MHSANVAVVPQIIAVSIVSCRAAGALCTMSCGRNRRTRAHVRQATCLSEPNDLNFSMFSLSMPLNSDQCRQYFLGLVTANMASHWRWGGTVWKLIKPLTCEVRKAI